MLTKINNVMTSASQVFFLPNVFSLVPNLKEINVYVAAKGQWNFPFPHFAQFVMEQLTMMNHAHLHNSFPKGVARMFDEINLPLVLADN